MKTKEELEQIKEEYTVLNKKLAELTEDELELVVGGTEPEEHNIMFGDAEELDLTGKEKKELKHENERRS